VLAVVQHQQRLPVPQPGEHRVDGRPAAVLVDGQGLRDGGADQVRVAERDQVDEVHAVPEPRRHRLGDAERQPGLADPARADRGHQPVTGDGLGQGDALAAAADERGERAGQPGGRRQRAR
jgi:hypothetical protein